MTRRITQSLIGALLLLVSLAKISPLAAASLEKVNASYGAISGSMAQTWVAKEARLYEKYGLDVNLVYISGGPRSIMVPNERWRLSRRINPANPIRITDTAASDRFIDLR